MIVKLNKERIYGNWIVRLKFNRLKWQILFYNDGLNMLCWLKFINF